MSCGGEGKALTKRKIKDYEYTRDKDEALELAEKLLDEKNAQERLDAAKNKEKEDELLKDYDGKERKLIKMAKQVMAS